MALYATRRLTSTSRHFREVEIALLQSLEDSDDAIEELMSLWLHESPHHTPTLLQMQESCSPGLIQEEAQLLHMIDSSTTTSSSDELWCEPMVRLASVYYYQGNSNESQKWTARALELKPWHFEAHQLEILNALRTCHHHSDDSQVLWKCARRALPALNERTHHRARKAWVTKAVQNAQESLDQALQWNQSGGEEEFVEQESNMAWQ